MYFNIRSTKVIFHRNFMKFIRSLEKKKIVLDIACADLKNADYFKDLNYTGADINMGRLEKGKKKCEDTDLYVVQCDILNIPFKEKKIDYVVSTHTFSHLGNNEDVLKAVTNLASLVGPAGKLFFNVKIISDEIGVRIKDLLTGYFNDIEDIQYGGVITELWDSMFSVSLKQNIKKRWFLRKILLVLSWLVSNLDFIGPRSRVIYIAHNN
ncbi:class I SAM-dependent methyltransferase [Elusimicrobiota bacterium]